MKYLLILFVATATLTISKAQTSKPDTAAAKASLQSAAQKMGALFVQKDYVAFIKYVNPKVLTAMGGKDKMMETLKAAMKQMEEQGISFNKFTIGEPSKIIYTKTDLESVVPQILELKTKDGRVVSTSYLVATSNDNGKTWYFVDTAGKTLAQMKTFIPSLSNELVIPAKTQPVFYKN
ncbi:MAG: hypothetical protein QM802_22305 [Agriterribacter sp.]